MFTDVTTGGNTTAALDTNGYMWTMGTGSNGAFGRTNTEYPVGRVDSELKFKKIGVSGAHSGGIDVDGNLWLWGSNYSGELGIGTSTGMFAINNIKKVMEGTKFKDFCLGNSCSAAIDTSGKLYTWGYCGYGLGSGSNSVNSPTQVMSETTFSKVFMSPSLSYNQRNSVQTFAAIDTSGKLWIWGNNQYGQLGNGNTTSKTTPIQIMEGKQFVEVSLGGYHSAAIDIDGKLWIWGRNSNAQLGNGTTTDSSTPIQVMEGTKFKKVSLGESHSSAIDEDGNLWVWGNNTSYQLGIQSIGNVSEPTTVTIGSAKFKQVSTNKIFSIAIDSEDTAWGWGTGSYSEREKTNKKNNEAFQITNVKQYSVTFKNYNGTVLQMKTTRYGGSVEYTGSTPTKNLTGYTCTFSGWDKSLENITEDTVVTAQFTEEANSYTLTVNPGGTQYTQKYKTTLSVTAPITKITYNYNYSGKTNKDTEIPFRNWAISGDSKGSLNNSRYNPATYTFGAGNDILTAYYDNFYLETPTRTGYIFGGWYKEAECINKIGDGNSLYAPTEDVTLYAKWIEDTYTIILDNYLATEKGTETLIEKYSDGIYNDNEKMTTDEKPITIPKRTYTVTFGDSMDEQKIYETREAKYTFKGYYDNSVQLINAEGYITNNFSSTRYSTDKTLNVQWEATSITMPEEIPTKTGYTFDGWHTNKDNDSDARITGTTYRPYSDITLYAHWKREKYAITLDKQGATKWGSSAIVENYGEGIYLDWYLTNKMTDTENPIELPEKQYTVVFDYNGSEQVNTQETRTFAFGGYYTEENGNGKQFIDSNGNITSLFTNTYFDGAGTLYAKWSTIAAIVLPTPEEREGYMFDGWYKDQACTDENEVTGTTYIPTESTILYAKWTKITYQITLDNSNATKNGTESLVEQYGDGIYIEDQKMTQSENPITKPERKYLVTFEYNGNGQEAEERIAEYEFDGYNDENVKLIDKNGYITDEFSSTKYTTPKTLNAQWVSAIITLPTPEERKGYSFEGWYTEEVNGRKVGSINNEYTPTEDIILYAHWKRNLYTITLDGQGATQLDTEKIFEDYDDGIYLDEDLANKMTTTQNSIGNIMRQYKITYDYNRGGDEYDIGQGEASYLFGGYYTEKNGNGTQLIDAGNRFITNDFTNTYFEEDSTIYAKWTEAAISLIEPQEREGYTFEGWYTAPDGGNRIGDAGEDYIPTRDIRIYAHWKRNIYTITLNNEGADETGSTEVYEEYANGVYLEQELENEMTNEDNCIELPEKKRTVKFDFNGGEKGIVEITPNCTFKGYYTEENGNGLEMINSDGYKTDNFTDTYYSDNDTIYALWEDTSIELLEEGNRRGYAFEGWYTAPEGGDKIGNPGDEYIIGSDMVIYAHWKGNLYTITLDSQEATTSGTEEIYENYDDGVYLDTNLEYKMSEHENRIDKPEKIKVITFDFNGGEEENKEFRVKDVFAGYYTEESGNGLEMIDPNGYKTDSFTNMYFGEDNTIYAKWGYTRIKLLESGKREGYTFAGWYTQAEGGNKVGQPGDLRAPIRDITLYAHWIKDEIKATYRVEHYFENAETGEYIIDENVTEEKEGEAGSLTEAQARKYNLYKAQDFEQEEINIDGSTVIRIYYDIIRVKVTFKNYDGTFLEEKEIVKGSNVEYTADEPVREQDGYTYEFIGWDKALENITEDTIITAQFKEELIVYNIYYKNVLYTESEDKENNEIQSVQSIMVKSNIYEDINMDNVKFERENPSTYTIETETFTLCNPTREGYTFEGWRGTDIEDIETEVTIEQGSTGDRQYEAVWTKNEESEEPEQNEEPKQQEEPGQNEESEQQEEPKQQEEPEQNEKPKQQEEPEESRNQEDNNTSKFEIEELTKKKESQQTRKNLQETDSKITTKTYEEENSTTATKIIPKTGTVNLFIIVLTIVVAVLVITIIVKNIELKDGREE